MTWKPGIGSPIGADEIEQARASNASAPPIDVQLRAILADPTATETEKAFAREWLADLEAEAKEAEEHCHG